MAFYLGIDGGGSKTACVIGDETTVLVRAVGGGSNPVRVGERAARIALKSAVREVCRQAQITPEQIERTCIGIAGATVPQTRATVQKLLGELVSGKILIAGDMEIALHAALGDEPGVIVIAGTGSIAFGRDEAGRTARSGGWGYAISDEGSGHWIGRRAVAAVTRAHEVGESGALERGLMRVLKIDSFEELIQIANATPAPNFAQLFPAVVAAADANDDYARMVLNDAGSELARLAANVAQRLWPETQTVRIAIAGGVFQHSALVRQAFHQVLQERRPRSSVSLDIVEPVYGALAMARRIGSR
jgi:N-acetylglucosamine kinase-like BadF-type ATPase